jgi:WD40 repeat protein
MSFARRSFILGAILAVAIGGAEASDKEGPRRDDLPPGAVARLGSLHLLHGPGVRDAVFSADGKTLLSAGADALRFWDVASGSQTRAIELQHLQVHANLNSYVRARLSGDGKLLATVHVDNWGKSSLIQIWDAATGRKLREIAGPGGYYEAFELSLDGKRLAMSTFDAGGQKPGRIVVWETADGKLLRRLEGSRAAVAFSPDGKFLASAVPESGTPPTKQTLFICNLATGRQVQEIELEASAWVGSLTFSPDGKFLAAGLHDAGTKFRTRRWDVTTGKEIAGFEKPVAFGVCFSPDGKLLAVQGGDRQAAEIQLLDAATGKAVRRLPGSDRWDRVAVFSADGRTLAVLGSRLRLFDVATGQEHHPAGGQRGPVSFLTFAADGKSLVVADAAGAGHWDLGTAKEQRRLTPGGQSHGWDGKVLTTLGSDHLHRWDPVTGKSLPGIEWQRPKGMGRLGRFSGFGPAALSPDGRLLAVGDSNLMRHAMGSMPPPNPTPVHLRDLAAGAAFRSFGAHDDDLFALAFSADGKTLATVGRLGAYLWETATGKKRATLEQGAAQPSGEPLLLQFTPDGKVVALAADEKAVHLMDTATGKKQGSLTVPAGVRLRSLAFAPDGKLAAAGCASGEVRIWDVASGKERRVLTGHRGAVGAVAFSADGKRLASGSDDTTVLVWDDPAQRSLTK